MDRQPLTRLALAPVSHVSFRSPPFHRTSAMIYDTDSPTFQRYLTKNRAPEKPDDQKPATTEDFLEITRSFGFKLLAAKSVGGDGFGVLMGRSGTLSASDRQMCTDLGLDVSRVPARE